ncbi:uncharacterized protein BYT42DRAFT_490813 [Radiomyces spectabilis]|uniref:uncharacterized protein n=1 Tax=Radiomyces spectabilis TaxID=64574 RepID=UPI00222020F7|nr:uncharacterized protein BYT42DRAFT_490813 [Radiomyces spectabilis]KAI8391807.1 hypothetical protein BYT42DRAFT_490813 [Radiomyces spectabilis]
MDALQSLGKSWQLTFAQLTTAIHQLSFLITGLATTLGVQWLFYKGAASNDSYLTQLAQYVGMVCVGFIIPFLLRNKTAYRSLGSEDDHDESVHPRISMELLAQNSHNDEEEKSPRLYTEGAVNHFSVMKLSMLDVVANFCVTLGFAVIGSGWIAIFGTSAGLALSSLDNLRQQSPQDNATTSSSLLMFGTLMTLGGTFFYSCVYVYSDHILSKQFPPPLPARVCFFTGVYTTIISLLWITFYTVPRFDQLIHVDQDVSLAQVCLTYAMVVVANATHSWNYYELIERTGSVSVQYRMDICPR